MAKEEKHEHDWQFAGIDWLSNTVTFACPCGAVKRKIMTLVEDQGSRLF